MLDRYSDHMALTPTRDKSAIHAYEALREWRGSSYLHRVHTDGSKELKQAVGRFGFNHTTSTPGRPQRNGVIENRVGFVKRQASACSKQGGLPATEWSWSCPYLCDAMNFAMKDGDSAYNRRFKHGKYNGHDVPFGAKVKCMLPSTNVKKQDKESAHAPKTKSGHS